MAYLDCPRCRLRLHSGVLYAEPNACPRCGEPLRPARASRSERLLRALLRRGSSAASPDWEEVTRAQYADRRHVSREEPPV